MGHGAGTRGAGTEHGGDVTEMGWSAERLFRCSRSVLRVTLVRLHKMVKTSNRVFKPPNAGL